MEENSANFWSSFYACFPFFLALYFANSDSFNFPKVQSFSPQDNINSGVFGVFLPELTKWQKTMAIVGLIRFVSFSLNHYCPLLITFPCLEINFIYFILVFSYLCKWQSSWTIFVIDRSRISETYKIWTSGIEFPSTLFSGTVVTDFGITIFIKEASF